MTIYIIHRIKLLIDNLKTEQVLAADTWEEVEDSFGYPFPHCIANKHLYINSTSSYIRNSCVYLMEDSLSHLKDNSFLLFNISFINGNFNSHCSSGAEEKKLNDRIIKDILE